MKFQTIHQDSHWFFFLKTFQENMPWWWECLLLMRIDGISLKSETLKRQSVKQAKQKLALQPCPSPTFNRVSLRFFPHFGRILKMFKKGLRFTFYCYFPQFGKALKILCCPAHLALILCNLRPRFPAVYLDSH